MWTQIIVSLVMMVISAALQAATMNKAQISKVEPGTLDTPTAEAGTTVPVVFGTVIAKQSNVAWYGDSSTQAIKSKSQGKK